MSEVVVKDDEIVIRAEGAADAQVVEIKEGGAYVFILPGVWSMAQIDKIAEEILRPLFDKRHADFRVICTGA